MGGGLWAPGPNRSLRLCWCCDWRREVSFASHKPTRSTGLEFAMRFSGQHVETRNCVSILTHNDVVGRYLARRCFLPRDAYANAAAYAMARCTNARYIGWQFKLAYRNSKTSKVQMQAHRRISRSCSLISRTLHKIDTLDLVQTNETKKWPIGLQLLQMF